MPPFRLVWTNEEGGEDEQITKVIFKYLASARQVIMSDLYPSKEALDATLASQNMDGFVEVFEQLDKFLANLI